MPLRLFLWLFLISPQTLMAAAAGYMVVTKGEAKLVSKQNQTQIFEASETQVPLEPGDQIQSNQAGLIQVFLREGQEEIQLYANGFLKVEAVLPEGTRLGLPIGKGRFQVTGALFNGKPRPFRVRTSNALIGVKGTNFVLQCDRETTSLVTLEGLVGMASAANLKISVDVPAGTATRAVQSAPPTPPVEVSKEAVEAILGESAGQETFDKLIFEAAPLPEETQEDKKDTKDQEETEGEGKDASQAEPLPPKNEQIKPVKVEGTQGLSQVLKDLGTAQTTVKETVKQVQETEKLTQKKVKIKMVDQ